MNNLVNDILQELNLTQEEFAFLFACGQNQVSQWARGKRLPQKARRRAIIFRCEEIKKHPELIELAHEELVKQRKIMRAGLVGNDRLNVKSEGARNLTRTMLEP